MVLFLKAISLIIWLGIMFLLIRASLILPRPYYRKGVHTTDRKAANQSDVSNTGSRYVRKNSW
ncbi:MAG: hypothetical protein GXY16_06090 [Syntrophomonadaceae bacterium]|nr:hypothetical protein [Syntrophomonadaceae bacterium]